LNALVGGFRKTQGCSLRNTPSVKEKAGVASQIKMLGRHNTGHNSVRVLALALAVLFVLFAAQALTHSHADGQNEAACQLCQAAHLGSAPTAGTASLVSPLLATGYVQPFIITIHQEFFFHDSPSRAPPSA
jgi:hypothetical protein